MQPPPRGCVLKPSGYRGNNSIISAAASARLCVETCDLPHTTQTLKAATFGWLCVETAHTFAYVGWQARAATFG